MSLIIPPSPTPWAKEEDSYDPGRGLGYDHGRGFIVRILTWAKEGDSYDYGKDFIVRILGGLKRDKGREGGGLYASPLIYISYIKCNFVTFYERILTRCIIYKNAILTFLTLFVKYVFEKKI